MWATDASDDALAVARANLAGTGVAATRVRIASGSWFGALPADLRGRIRVIVANPPYIAEHEVPDLPRDVIEWEPYGALVSGPTGMESIEAIVAGAPDWLDAGEARSSWSSRRTRHRTRANAHVPRGSHEVTIRADLTGRDRVLVGAARLASVPDMADELDVDAMIARFRERAAAVKDRPLPPVAGADRQRFIDQAQTRLPGLRHHRRRHLGLHRRRPHPPRRPHQVRTEYGWPISPKLGSMGAVKTTIDIADGLLEEARAAARRRRTTLRALVEDGLRRTLDATDSPAFTLRDTTLRGGRGLTPEFMDAGWDRIRDVIYETGT